MSLDDNCIIAILIFPVFNYAIINFIRILSIFYNLWKPQRLYILHTHIHIINIFLLTSNVLILIFCGRVNGSPQRSFRCVSARKDSEGSDDKGTREGRGVEGRRRWKKVNNHGQRGRDVSCESTRIPPHRVRMLRPRTKKKVADTRTGRSD